MERFSRASLGDKLREKIEEGLRLSRFGVVILSPHSADKSWPRDEIRALMAREERGVKRVLPVLHELEPADVADAFPLLGDRLSVSTSAGMSAVADVIEKTVLDPRNQSPASTSPTVARQFIALLEQRASRDDIRAFLRSHREIVIGGGTVETLTWEPHLGEEAADYATGQQWRSVSRFIWTVTLLAPQDPFGTDNAAMTAALDAWVHRGEAMRSWVSSHLREARETLEEIEINFPIVIVMGRRPQPHSPAAQWLRAYNDAQFDVRIRTYDWLIDAALALEETK